MLICKHESKHCKLVYCYCSESQFYEFAPINQFVTANCKQPLYKYAIVPVICCPKNYLDKVKSFLKHEGIISSENEIGKTVHIILGSPDVRTINSEGPPDMLLQHNKYLKNNSEYQNQLKNVGITIDVPTDIDDRFFIHIATKLIDKKNQSDIPIDEKLQNKIKKLLELWGENNLTHQIQSCNKNCIVDFKIEEPGGHAINSGILSILNKKMSTEKHKNLFPEFQELKDKKEELGMLSCNLGFDKQDNEHGLLFDKNGKASDKSKQEFLIKLSKKEKWVEKLVNEKIDESSAQEFLSESFIVTSYVKKAECCLSITEMLAQAPLADKKQLIILSNLKAEDLKKQIEKRSFFDNHRIELITSETVEIIEPKNTDEKTRTIKIVSDIFLPSDEHTELIRLSNFAMVTGDDSMRKAIDIGLPFWNELMRHKKNSFIDFINVIESLNIMGADKIVKFLTLSMFETINSAELASLLTEDFITVWDEIIKKLKQDYDFANQIDGIIRRTTLLHELPELIENNPTKAKQELETYFLSNPETYLKTLNELRTYYSGFNKDQFKYVIDFIINEVTDKNTVTEILKNAKQDLWNKRVTLIKNLDDKLKNDKQFILNLAADHPYIPITLQDANTGECKI
jgi:hypothetical protein